MKYENVTPCRPVAGGIVETSCSEREREEVSPGCKSVSPRSRRPPSGCTRERMASGCETVSSDSLRVFLDRKTLSPDCGEVSE